VGLWTVAIDGAVDTVRALKEAGYRLGVVSNAEGRVEQDLNGAGFRGLFDTVVDSHLVGVEKPDPRIFQIALERMKVEAASAVFLGDVPAVDVAGASAAGLTPFLLDRHGLYADHGPRRVTSIRELPALLSN
jgi:putative hydrolase of the HAD superfamily